MGSAGKHPNETSFYMRLVESISRRYRLNADKSLHDVYEMHEDFLDVDADVRFVAENRDKILAVLSDPDLASRLVNLFVNSTVEFTYASNQFIHITQAEELELKRIYRAYIADMAALLATQTSPEALKTGLETLIVGHFGDLRTNISRFFDPEVGQNVQANVILNQAVCEEYSPIFQLELLGLRVADLVEPVLDLGCGKAGHLVNFLNAKGVRAVGVDRLAEGPANLIRSDWLTYKLQTDTWGTVISHMAFSNHFIFHHLYKYGSSEKYARQYMAILTALKPGGSFYYAPGLPFIEQYLPAASYAIQRHAIESSEVYRSPSGKPLGDEVLYACRVLKK